MVVHANSLVFFVSGLFYCSTIAMTAVPHFRDLELIITEGIPKSVVVELSTNVMKPLIVEVYAASIPRFQEMFAADGSQCTQISGDLNLLNSSLLDSAEGKTYAMH